MVALTAAGLQKSGRGEGLQLLEISSHGSQEQKRPDIDFHGTHACFPRKVFTRFNGFCFSRACAEPGDALEVASDVGSQRVRHDAWHSRRYLPRIESTDADRGCRYGGRGTGAGRCENIGETARRGEERVKNDACLKFVCTGHGALRCATDGLGRSARLFRREHDIQ